MQETVELTQKQKLKKFNEKLQLMMKSKNIDKSKLSALIPKKQQQKQQNKQQQIVKISEKKSDTQQKAQQKQQKSHQQKTKLIKKSKPQSDITLRKAAGTVWKDKSLQDWPQNDYRIFVGNLGNQVSDQMLSMVFRMRYKSFQLAKVVLDKRTSKTRGYGFVSFKDPKDFLNALKEMDGKYVGNRPVKITKSNWKDRALESDRNKQLPSDFKSISDKQTNKVHSNFKYTSPY